MSGWFRTWSRGSGCSAPLRRPVGASARVPGAACGGDLPPLDHAQVGTLPITCRVAFAALNVTCVVSISTLNYGPSMKFLAALPGLFQGLALSTSSRCASGRSSSALSFSFSIRRTSACGAAAQGAMRAYARQVPGGFFALLPGPRAGFDELLQVWVSHPVIGVCAVESCDVVVSGDSGPSGRRSVHIRPRAQARA